MPNYTPRSVSFYVYADILHDRESNSYAYLLHVRKVEGGYASTPMVVGFASAADAGEAAMQEYLKAYRPHAETQNRATG